MKKVECNGTADSSNGKFRKFFIDKHVFFYGIICLVMNILAVLATGLLSVPSNALVLQWQHALEDKESMLDSIGLFCYAVPLLCCVLYVLPLRKLKKNDGRYIEIMVHLPASYALRGTLGWICFFVLDVAFLLYLKFTSQFEILTILISMVLSFSFLSVFTFTMIYFTLETLNRNIVLPSLYPEGKLSGVTRMSLSSIRNTFILYFISAGIFPTLIGLRLSCVEHPVFRDYLCSVILALLGFVLTILISNYFRKPLKKLTDSADKIAAGNYDTKTVICSNDELGALGDSFNAMARSLKEKEFMRDTFGKVVTPQVRDFLLNNKVTLGGETKNVTVMFCDIRSFTSLSEKLSSEDVVKMLNIYFTAMEKCISAYNGVINKYIGDCVMALFGAPIANTSHAHDAYCAALEMRKSLAGVNAAFAALGLPQIKNGIGLHTGSVTAGNIGTESRMEYTVIGDTVNVASRIEGLCKEYGETLLMSEETARAAGNGPVFLCESPIRGKEEKIRIWKA